MKMVAEAYHDSRASNLYSATIPLVVVATFAVGSRLVARKISAAKYWWDDWTLVLALVRTETLP